MEQKNFTEKERLQMKHTAHEVAIKIEPIVEKIVEHTIQKHTKDLGTHISKKLYEQLSQLDISIREIKKEKSTKKTNQDTLKQIIIIVIGALLIGLMPSLFKFIAEALNS